MTYELCPRIGHWFAVQFTILPSCRLTSATFLVFFVVSERTGTLPVVLDLVLICFHCPGKYTKGAARALTDDWSSAWCTFDPKWHVRTIPETPVLRVLTMNEGSESRLVGTIFCPHLLPIPELIPTECDERMNRVLGNGFLPNTLNHCSQRPASAVFLVF